MSRARGSPKARRSRVSRSSGRSRSRTRAARSRTVAVSGSGPRQAQASTPGTRVSSPRSRTAPNRSRSSRRSPWHRRCRRFTVSGSRPPPAPAASRCAVSSGGSSSPVHSREIAPGAGMPSVAVTSSRVRPCTASWWTRAAEASSRRWASSTISSRTEERSCTARCRVTSSGSRCAKAAKGMERASGVPATRAQSVPRAASATSRVLPQPADPVTTIPCRPAASDLRISSTSLSRPVNGQGSSRVFASRSNVITPNRAGLLTPDTG